MAAARSGLVTATTLPLGPRTASSTSANSLQQDHAVMVPLFKGKFRALGQFDGGADVLRMLGWDAASTRNDRLHAPEVLQRGAKDLLPPLLPLLIGDIQHMPHERCVALRKHVQGQLLQVQGIQYCSNQLITLSWQPSDCMVHL